MALVDIYGNIISSGGNDGSHFKEVKTIPNGLQLPEVPSDFVTNEYWMYTGNSGNLATVVGSARYMYRGMVFTGRVYVRYTTTTPYVPNPVAMHIVAGDYLTNQTEEGETLTPTLDTAQFDGQYAFVKEDGTDGIKQTSGENPDGYPRAVRLAQYDIPEGKYAVLSSSGKGTTGLSNAYVPSWFTVFTIDPKDDITQIPNNSTLYSVSAYNLEGFGKGTAENEYFLKYFKEQADKAIPIYYRPHTYGKSLYVGGDSLHAYSGGNGFESSGFISDYNKYLGFKSIKNDGYAGSTWTGTTGGGAIKRVTDLVASGTVYDVVILAWGTNSDNSIGTVDDEASNTATTTCGAMKWCIEQLRTAFPNTVVGVIVPPPSSNQGTSLDEKADAMIDVCEKMNVPYVDMRKYISTKDLSDGTHLNVSGSKKYGSAEAKLILDICPYGEPLK